ncbi:hypothetical protein DXG03_003608 [Asterophora parasitica]|uniref:Uncharacterized protein n=1 Tax=Asterophora parasitica TaxID=117018 RepID=A0A9P7G3G6_9AGAR|nr:hypothetical protein DXG03_003608 [Asterophora parasitica]
MAWMLVATSDTPIPSNRIPARAYENLNGFTYSSYPGPISHEPEEDLSEPTTAALDAHRRAQYVLTQKDRPIPTFEQMQQEVVNGDTVSSIKQRIVDLHEQHISDMQRLYTWHAEEYHDEAFNHYLAKDDLQYPADGENNPVLKESYAELETIYEDRGSLSMQMQWDDDIERMRHSYLLLLNDLHLKLKKQEEADEDARKRREADFPISIEDYNTKSKEIQRRAARFLMLNDPALQEKMLTQYGWASRQVKPLQEIFQKNDAFKADVITQVLGDVQDPRMR